ncbi:phosphoribosylglycinamide formyltransferase [Corynebacterium sp. HMSC22B11]|uniref:Phosphoribosylglycinamide formyltransferase n=1 Tax=Corynebacterium urealyticum (strain ATCC 43042 / DSM 7109) TaxID=504474 RepID=B1VFF4_CORU7|nr:MULTISPECIES: phosphoribosylglycinamide formyltransferase [Corynebacterium]AGE36109.1 phosphoribosylglycinamide formyltransferase [Corynebacterium urealyticum DSM 7111]OFO14423.1 phosphoribosylglycinamide formyltransferase [Corynebacterium sp. HMSC22B11]QQB07789.1 phosphoribosylglycinamide formyltransferase [Corynebacterium urealyticum]QQC42014.1 phosphoribosylglycinamide formyltransferase [Corynebacterium urealyticum]CAQ04493.1 phosphoribosylglycinamide formyltransferase [Corynebacterium u
MSQNFHTTLPAPQGRPLRIVALASGSGTLVQALIDNLDSAKVELLAIGADRDCAALERAEKAGLPTFKVEYIPKVTDRGQWNRDLIAALESWDADLIVSAGFMRIIGADVVERFPGRIINTHPALLPSFPGAQAVVDAIEYGVKVTGSTVHVVDAGVDSGPIVAQEAVNVHPSDKVESLHEKIKHVERRLIVQVLHEIAGNGLTIEGRKAQISSND